MLADKNQKTSVDGMNQLFTLKRDETNDKSFNVDGDMKNDLGQNKLLTKVNVSRAVKLIYEGNDKSEEDKSVEEKKSSVQDLENMLIIMRGYEISCSGRK